MVRASGLLILVLAAFVCGSATPARADVFKFFGEVQGGAMGGKGLSGDQKAAAFFERAPHPTYGVLVGARVLILQTSIEHHQYTQGDGVSTWTQFAAGLAIEAGLGTEKQKKAKQGGFIDFGANLAFGLGTGQQVMPPLSNDEVTDKGFIVEGRIGAGTHLSKYFDLGIAVPVSWGYFFKNGVDDTANNVSTHYGGFQVHGLVYLRANLSLF